MQLALPLHQEHINVVRSNKVVRGLPTESNVTPKMELGCKDMRTRRYTNNRGREPNIGIIIIWCIYWWYLHFLDFIICTVWILFSSIVLYQILDDPNGIDLIGFMCFMLYFMYWDQQYFISVFIYVICIIWISLIHVQWLSFWVLFICDVIFY